MKQFLCEISSSGPFDRCLECDYLGAGCSGPRTTAMTYDRYGQWMRALREKRRMQGCSMSLVQIAEACGLSKNTVDNFFAGKNKDISRSTAGLIEDYLIGGDAKWPCSMDLNEGKDIVYQDRPETLEALAHREKVLSEIHASYQSELDAIREEAQKKIDYLKQENENKTKIIDRLLK